MGACQAKQSSDSAATCPVAHASSNDTSLFKKLGGHAAVNAVVDDFYNRIMKDPSLIPFFAGVDMASQRKKQASFMMYVFGGPDAYKGKDLYTAHKELIEKKGMKEVHFDAVAGHLKDALLGCGVSKDLTNEVLSVVATTKPIIFGKDAQKQTLFQRVGGHAAVKATVDNFYDRIMADPSLKPFFEGIDMSTQRKKQASFMMYVFGGPEQYKGKDMYTAHKDLIEKKGMSEVHFDKVAGHLQDALLSLGVQKDLVAEVIAVVATTKPLIFGKEAAPKETLFQRLGGHAAVKAAVDNFYVRVLNDPTLKPFFEGIDMVTQRKKQASFMMYVFGGPDQYKGKDMYLAHKDLIEKKGMNESHFNSVAGHLQDALLDLGISKDLVAEVISIVATTKPLIFGKKAAPKDTLFQRLGGHAAVKAAVDNFYVRVLNDPTLKPFFEGIDMTTQRKKQASFMMYVFGGPDQYKGKDMYLAHKDLIEKKGMNESHFNSVAGHLQDALLDLGVNKDLVSEVIALVATTKPLIFGKGR